MPRKDIKARWKDSILAKSERSPLFTRRGRASTRGAEPATPQSPEADLSSTDTSATATGSVTVERPILTSMLSAESTTKIFSEPTVWQMSLIGYVESGSRKITEQEWAQTSLQPEHLSKLDALADGRGCPREVVIGQIAAWMGACSDPRLYNNIEEVLAFYLDNYVLG